MPKKQTKEEYLNWLSNNYPGNVDVTKVNYVNSTTKIHLKCLDCGTDFFPTPQDTKKKPRPSGCPKCGRDKTNSMLQTRVVTPEVLEPRFRIVHGTKFKYDWNSYTNSHSTMRMLCPSHGWVTTTPSNHEAGADCWYCGIEKRSSTHRIPFPQAVIKSRLAHGDTYGYVEEGYTGSRGMLKVVCRKHGLFEQYANDHWSGHGCRKCSTGRSRGQIQFCEFLKNLGLSTEEEYQLKSGKSLDVVCVDLGIAFEYDGLWWHCESNVPDKTYHLRKTLEAKAEGLRLIHVFEDEWIHDRNRTENWIKTIVGKQSEKHSARTLKVSTCPWSIASVFLEKNHMQGKGSSSGFAYSLSEVATGEIMAIMSFSSNNTKGGSIELTRFCSRGLVRGGFTKLLTAFLRDHSTSYSEIISFSDNRWSLGEIYSKTGFECVSYSRPSYYYVKAGRRFHKRGFQRKHLARRFKNFDPLKSESENCLDNGFYRLWDCGKTKWSLKL